MEAQALLPEFEIGLRAPGRLEVSVALTLVGLTGFEIDEGGTAAVELLIRPGFRRQGYGRGILQALCCRPEARRAKELIAPVERDHEAAVRCVQAAGFANTGPDPDDSEFLRFVRKTR